MKPSRGGLGAIILPGTQWQPWIHIDDEVALFAMAIHDQRVTGGLNASAPNPARFTDDAHAMGHIFHRRVWLRLPGTVMRLTLGDVADAVLHNRRMIPAKALHLGHEFTHPVLEYALADLLLPVRRTEGAHLSESVSTGLAITDQQSAVARLVRQFLHQDVRRPAPGEARVEDRGTRDLCVGCGGRACQSECFSDGCPAFHSDDESSEEGVPATNRKAPERWWRDRPRVLVGHGERAALPRRDDGEPTTVSTLVQQASTEQWVVAAWRYQLGRFVDVDLDHVRTLLERGPEGIAVGVQRHSRS